MMLRIGAWNIRGAHQVIKQDQCKQLISTHQLAVLAVLETKLNLAISIKAAEYINPRWKFIHNHNEATYGRILILYNPNLVQLSPILSTPQLIHCHALDINEQSTFYVSFVYAYNSVNARESLLSVIPSLRQNTHPWLILGDFNCCHSLSDRMGGNPLSLSEIKPLADALYDSDLVKIRTLGMQYTWNNKRRHGCRTFSTIDHSFSNQSAYTKWPLLFNHIPPPLLSDHSPQIIHLREADLRGKSNFKFFNSWTSEPDFKNIVLSAWNLPINGNHLYVLQEKIRETRKVLKQ